MNVWGVLPRRDPPPPPPAPCPTHLGSGPETFWYQLSGTQRNQGPIDTSAFNPLFCSGKARRGRKFKHEDSVQIAVTLAREGPREGRRGIEAGRGKRNYCTFHHWRKSCFLSINFPIHFIYLEMKTKESPAIYVDWSNGHCAVTAASSPQKTINPSNFISQQLGHSDFSTESELS